MASLQSPARPSIISPSLRNAPFYIGSCRCEGHLESRPGWSGKAGRHTMIAGRLVRRSALMRRIFISYRRSDTEYQAGRIYDRLVRKFPRAGVFKDVDSVPAGADFRVVIEQAIQKSDVVIAVIGPSWSSVVDHKGHRRLDDGNDYVRFELENAVRLGKHIIPVLVGSAEMPRPADLPASLEGLAFKTAVPVRPDPDFHRDLDRLIRAIKLGGAAHKTLDGAFQPGARRWVRTAAVAVGGMVMAAVLGLIIYIELRPRIEGPGPNDQSREPPGKREAPEAGLEDRTSKAAQANPAHEADIDIGPTKRQSDSPSGKSAGADRVKWCSIETRSDGDKKLKIGIVALPAFYGDEGAILRGDEDALSATADCRKTLSTFRADGVDAVVIDLRAHGGGLLDEAITFSGLFIDTGPVVQIKDPSGVKHLDDEYEGTSWDGPLVVLVDTNSYGAAEVFAGVIKDYGRGLLVGDSRTAGVDPGGSPFVLASPGAGRQFYRTDGERISTEGVASDVVVPSGSSRLAVATLTNSEPRIPGMPHDNYHRVPADLVAILRDRSATRRAAGRPFKGPDTPTTAAWESSRYNDEVIRITVDYLTLGSKVLAAAPEPARVSGQ